MQAIIYFYNWQKVYYISIKYETIILSENNFVFKYLIFTHRFNIFLNC